jgi:large subunit ribosomal protein L3
MGSVSVSVKNITVVEVRPDQNLLLVRGAVPGGDNALVLITKG